jgi:hypothetical protein
MNGEFFAHSFIIYWLIRPKKNSASLFNDNKFYMAEDLK